VDGAQEIPGLVAGVAVTSTPTPVGPGAAKGCWPDRRRVRPTRSHRRLECDKS
jgi:hypothetical protein